MSSKQAPKLAIFSVISAIAFFAVFFAVQAQNSPDAIAIRVIPNSDHISAARWFSEKKFSGSPQSLMVDGYRAIRDGRTVYVNVANIDGSALYTNIYLISYNQSAEQQTTDVFAQMLKHWKFNTNYSDTGTCQTASTTKCLIDSDCANDDYCRSDKAEIIRDTIRLEDIADMKSSIVSYKKKNGNFPAVNSGSYLPNTVISTWPSWQKVLSQTLAFKLPADPVNQLGDCGDSNFNATTCWDENTKRFADSDIADPHVNLPSGSRVYLYASDAQGLNFSLCSVMESGYITDITDGACDGSAEYIIEDTIDNRAPAVEGENSISVCGAKELKAYFSGTDPDGDNLAWTLDAGPASQWSSWPSAPVMRNTSVPGMKEVYAPSAGLIGNYGFTVTASDGKGLAQEFTQSISVTDCVPPVITRITNVDTGAVLYTNAAPGAFTITAIIGRAINLLIEASDTENSFPLSFNFTGLPGGFNSAGSLDANNHDYHVAGVVEDRTKPYAVSLTAKDVSGAESKPPVSFTINLVNNPPAITSAPLASAEACVNYSYNITAVEPDSHSLAFLNSGSLPLNLTFNASAGLLSGYVTNAGTYPISLSALDEYFSLTDAPSSAQSIQTYSLNVTPENFIITSDFDVPTVPVVYAVPDSVALADLYHGPWTFMATAEANVFLGGETWSQTHTAVPASTTIAINSATGLVNVSAFDSVIPPAGMPVTVTLRAVNVCGTERQKNFSLMLRPNEWCGDAQIQASLPYGETCDDGNHLNNDGCNATCQAEFCGDNIKQASEGCDNGLSNTNVPCIAAYDGACSYCNLSCVPVTVTGPRCGDGTMQAVAGEQCDNGAGNTDTPCGATCSAACSYCSTSCVSATVPMLNCCSFDQDWTFTDEGFIAGGQEGAFRAYDDPLSVASSPWVVSNEGRTVRLNWENDGNCMLYNYHTQIATATTNVKLCDTTTVTVTWSGVGEREEPNFDVMSFYVNGALVGSAHAPGGKFDCAGGVGPVISSPPPPQQVTLPAGDYVFQIKASTNDSMFHMGAWYQFDMTFE
jgi:cysteine-rich repeat protein